MKEETLEKIITVIRTLPGLALGTIDCITTGVPIMSAGVPIYELAALMHSTSTLEGRRLVQGTPLENAKEYVKGSGPYLVGASIPFLVKYHKEIGELVNNLGGL